MRTIIAIIALVLATAAGANAEIIAGPIINPSNGHEYYLLWPSTWSASETEAENLGGTLAIVNSAADQEWVFSKFGSYDGQKRSLWIGLHRQYPGGPFAWVNGAPVEFLNWDAGEPNNCSGVETCVQVYESGKWNDNQDTANPVCGVVEVPGRSNPESLTQPERKIIGNWYESGNPDLPCYVAATENRLFAIDYNRNTSRLLWTPEGFFFASNGHTRGDLVGDKIVWSNGRWWSRSPLKFSAADKLERE